MVRDGVWGWEVLAGGGGGRPAAARRVSWTRVVVVTLPRVVAVFGLSSVVTAASLGRRAARSFPLVGGSFPELSAFRSASAGTETDGSEASRAASVSSFKFTDETISFTIEESRDPVAEAKSDPVLEERSGPVVEAPRDPALLRELLRLASRLEGWLFSSV